MRNYIHNTIIKHKLWGAHKMKFNKLVTIPALYTLLKLTSPDQAEARPIDQNEREIMAYVLGSQLPEKDCPVVKDKQNCKFSHQDFRGPVNNDTYFGKLLKSLAKREGDDQYCGNVDYSKTGDKIEKNEEGKPKSTMMLNLCGEGKAPFKPASAERFGKIMGDIQTNKAKENEILPSAQAYSRQLVGRQVAEGTTPENQEEKAAEETAKEAKEKGKEKKGEVKTGDKLVRAIGSIVNLALDNSYQFSSTNATAESDDFQAHGLKLKTNSKDTANSYNVDVPLVVRAYGPVNLAGSFGFTYLDADTKQSQGDISAKTDIIDRQFRWTGGLEYSILRGTDKLRDELRHNALKIAAGYARSSSDLSIDDNGMKISKDRTEDGFFIRASSGDQTGTLAGLLDPRYSVQYTNTNGSSEINADGFKKSKGAHSSSLDIDLATYVSKLSGNYGSAGFSLGAGRSVDRERTATETFSIAPGVMHRYDKGGLTFETYVQGQFRFNDIADRSVEMSSRNAIIAGHRIKY